MKTLSLEDFFAQYPDIRPANHHLTGPPHVWRDEGTGSVYHSEGRVLAALAASLGPDVLEIGALAGVSTRYIHEGLERNRAPGVIHSVDFNHLWEDDAGWPRRRRIQADCRTFPFDDLSCRWAFIDGDHTYPFILNDCAAALRAGCTAVIFHDCAERLLTAHDSSDGARAVPDFFSDKPDWSLTYIDTPSGLVLATKK